MPSKGFGMHGHRDMEIVTYVLEGALAHKDSMGNGSILRLRGRVEVNGQAAEAGDGFAVSDEPLVGVVGRGSGEVMLFDMA